jgi:surface polysaccharide O-acyltransferase-like enzyme
MQSGSVSVKKERKVYLDLIRILAAFCVIFNHTNDNGFFLFAAREWGSFTFWGYMFFSVFCKAAVPLFLMISGALMLSREEPASAVSSGR